MKTTPEQRAKTGATLLPVCIDGANITMDAGTLRTLLADLEEARASLNDCNEAMLEMTREIHSLKVKLAAAEKGAERWQKLKAYYTAAVFDPEREDGLDLGEGVALVFLLPKGSRVSANADATIDDISAQKEAT